MAPYSGYFFDGQTATKHTVTVGLDLDSLTINEADGALSVRWPFPDLRAVRKIKSNQPVELTSCAAPDARLTIDDPAFAEAVLDRAPHLARRRGYTPRWWERPWTVTAIIALTIGGIVLAVLRLAGPLARAVPDSWRSNMGAAAENLFTAGDKTCRAADGLLALDRLTATLRATQGAEASITVKIVDSKMINAFALPGGKIVVMTGLLDLMEAPDEFAGVLAHEIGHVTERHPTEAALRALGLSWSPGCWWATARKLPTRSRPWAFSL